MAEYKIGTSQAGLTLLTELGLLDPHSEFNTHSVEVDAGSGRRVGHGWATELWEWGYLTGGQRATLRTYIPNAGASIYIRTLTQDGTTWKDFLVEAIWPFPEPERIFDNQRLRFALQFRAMVELEDLE